MSYPAALVLSPSSIFYTTYQPCFAVFAQRSRFVEMVKRKFLFVSGSNTFYVVEECSKTGADAHSSDL